ncbi:WG repeat-containing protein [Chryseobacterium limigenitum]|uniref:WG containing repeat-containing protein n=1 Tax=Chryseobacterium limigenitum TaxID=1612149 RepID=A0A1K2IN06_9FLAO|nr:WG repeat-containing protein [Chryseobacterium limigenitum]SFZ93853.1 WG containing repeat-containing protein [Chryseobacterium limigenitum]
MAQQTDQYKQILLSKELGKEVRFYTKGYGIISDPHTGKSGIVDSSGSISFDYPFKSEISRLSKNRFILKTKDAISKGKTALIDAKGDQLIALDNFKFRTWENKDRMIYSKDGKDCVYDYNGKQIIPFYDEIQFASENRFFVKKDNGWFIYDFEGQQVSDREFKENLRFYKGKVYLTTGAKSGEVLDNNGKTVSTFSDHYIEDINGFPFLITKDVIKNKYGIVDENENVLADEIYEQAFVGREYIYLIHDNNVSIFSKAEKKVYPTDFHYVNHLFNGMFKTLKDDRNPKIAVLKTNGEIIFPKEYDVVEAFKIKDENYLYVSKDGEEKLLDKNLNSILDDGYQIEKVFFDNLIVKKEDTFYKFLPKDKSYTELKNITSIKRFQFYPAIICKNKENLYGMLDEAGNEIIPFVYDDIFTFFSGDEVVVQKGNKFGVTNLKNEPLKEVVYDKYSVDRKKIKLTRGKESEFIDFTSSENKVLF